MYLDGIGRDDAVVEASAVLLEVAFLLDWTGTVDAERKTLG